jgi:hypothetical protein
MRSHNAPVFSILAVGLLLAALACSENTLRTLEEVVPPPLGVDDDDAIEEPQDDDDAGVEEPPLWRNDCPPEAIATAEFYGPNGESEIAVLDSDPTEASATLVVPFSGVYALYDTAVAESGASQINETGYIRIRNAANPSGVPSTSNCEDEYIVQDNDNSGLAPAPLIYLGTFPLLEGENALTLYHFCPLFEQGMCSEFHIGDPGDSSGCSGNGPNSIHLAGEAICLVPR